MFLADVRDLLLGVLNTGDGLQVRVDLKRCSENKALDMFTGKRRLNERGWTVP